MLLIKGASEETPYPLYERGSIPLSVEPSARRLSIEILPSVETARPGEAVPIHIRVTDHQGHPVEAEVGVAVTDEAALDVYNNTTKTLEETFYGLQPDSVVDSTSLKFLLTPPVHTTQADCGGGSGNGSIDDALLREDFIYTPLWTTVLPMKRASVMLRSLCLTI